MSQEAVVIVDGVRTPFVRARSVYQRMPPSTLGGLTINETLGRAGLEPNLVEEVYFGIVSSPFEGTNVAREAVFDSGCSAQIPATTINRYCASSAEAVSAIAAKISSGQIEIGCAGGVESISTMRAVFSQEATNAFQDFGKAKTLAQRFGVLGKLKPQFLFPIAPGIKEPTTGLTMGQSADLMAREFKISRQEQDAYAFESHQKAAASWEKGFYTTHVLPVSTPEGKWIQKDTDVRADASLQKMAALKPIFYPDGTITAGNASPLTDGASCVLMMKETRAKQLGLKILGRLRSVTAAAVDIKKEPLLIGPVYAIPKALAQAKIEWKDLDLIEIHEAFAGQVLSTIKAIESTEWAKTKMGLGQAIGSVDTSKLNVHGGSISLGHPFGATGTRMVLQALHGLRAHKKNLALISICAAGGLGMVLVVEAV